MFYDILKAVCKKKHTTPCAGCVALGISKSNATKWKRGKSPNLDVVIRIADLLDVSPASLVPKKNATKEE